MVAAVVVDSLAPVVVAGVVVASVVVVSIKSDQVLPVQGFQPVGWVEF